MSRISLISVSVYTLGSSVTKSLRGRRVGLAVWELSAIPAGPLPSPPIFPFPSDDGVLCAPDDEWGTLEVVGYAVDCSGGRSIKVRSIFMIRKDELALLLPTYHLMINVPLGSENRSNLISDQVPQWNCQGRSRSPNCLKITCQNDTYQIITLIGREELKTFQPPNIWIQRRFFRNRSLSGCGIHCCCHGWGWRHTVQGFWCACLWPQPWISFRNPLWLRRFHTSVLFDLTGCN